MKWTLKNLRAVRPWHSRGRFIYHKNLDRRIWTDGMVMRELVSNALQIATWGYIASMQKMGFPLSDDAIHDIFIHGSTANYYYDDTSDIDICIVADLSGMRAAFPGVDLYTLMKSALGSWRRNYRVRICGRGVDFEIVDINDVPRFGPNAYKVGGMYSIMRDEWIRPTIRLRDDQIRTIRRDARHEFRQIYRMYRKIVRDGMAPDFIETFLARLTTQRRQTFYDSPAQPVSARTMAFRMARRCGIVRDLRERAIWHRSKNFNLD